MIITHLNNINQDLQTLYKNIAEELNIQCLNYYEWLNDFEKVNNLSIENHLISYTSATDLSIKNIEDSKKSLLFISDNENIFNFLKYLITKIQDKITILENSYKIEGLLCA